MKKFVFPFIYISSILSSELAQQQFIEDFIVASEPITFTNDQKTIDFSSLNNSVSEDLISPPAPVAETSHKRPWLAAGLSALFPGLGQMYLGDMRSAGIMASSAGVCLGINISQLQDSKKSNDNILLPSLIAYSTNSYYSTYAAYRDARVANGLTNYSYRMPMEGFTDLTYAPFQWSVLKKPEVWGGILGAVAIASTVVAIGYSNSSEVKIAASSESPYLMPPLALPVAIGEESFFRGFIQSAISENINPMAGLALSSLAFGAAHIPNALVLEKEDQWRYYTFSLPMITALGAYCGWMTQKNHSLKESVALHMWYDFIVFSAAALATHKACATPMNFAISTSF